MRGVHIRCFYTLKVHGKTYMSLGRFLVSG